MAEKVTEERPNPVEALRERVEQLEKIVEKGAKDVETFTRERPMYALSITFLAGMFVGFVVGAAAFKGRD